MGWYIFFALIGIVVGLLFCFKFSSIAAEKGYSATSYFWLCFFFGMIGYIVVAALPDASITYKLNDIERKLNNSSQSAHTETRAEKINNTSAVADNKWICVKCNTANNPEYGQCKKCGTYRH